MPSLRDPARGEAVFAVMTRLALAHGLPGLSLRAIATEVGIAPSTLVAQFTHSRRLVTWFCSMTGSDRIRSWGRELGRHGLEALVPRDQEALEREGVWSVVVELGRRDDDVSDIVQGQVEEERDAITYFLRLQAAERGEDVTPQARWAPDPDEVLLLAAVLDGLRAAMVRTLEPMPEAEARRLLHRASGALHRSARLADAANRVPDDAPETGGDSQGNSAA